MKSINVFLRGLSGALGAVLAALVLPAIASAGCGLYTLGTAMHASPRIAITQEQDGGESGTRWRHDGVEPIVGMWKTVFTATDGSGYSDFGYSQWHSDGTEMLNSGSRAPATQNYCLGVWEKTEGGYQLNHFALSYDATTGDLNGKVNIREEVKVSADGLKYTGTFLISVYDPTGQTVRVQFSGNITGTRVTVNTKTP